MEESDLLKERLQAITEKRRVQEDIRQKKQELDREKLKLQHLKKKALREQWLLEDSTSHNALHQCLLADHQQTRALQSNIHRIEREVEFLEREESMISTNESFILKRLKAVEKSPEEIIKEAQDSFIPEPIQVATVIPDLPASLSPPVNRHNEPNTPRQTLFAMEINVAKNLLTGESAVVSTAPVAPKELHQHTGVKVYDDGRKCVYALEAKQGSHKQGCASELSANEVEQLLRDATLHRHGNHQNNSKRDGHFYSNHQDERHQGEGYRHRNQGEGHYIGNHHLRNNLGEKDCRYTNHQKKNCQKKQEEGQHYGDWESHYNSQERNYHSNQREGHRLGNHQGEVHHYGNRFYQERNCHSNQGYQCGNQRGNQRGNHHGNGIIRSSSRISQGARSNDCPPPRSHDQEVVLAYQPELCYTPANHIPLSDYIHVEEEELCLYSPPRYHSHSQSENGHNRDNNGLFSGPAPSDRAPSPIYEADTPYTILSTMETTEPITAVFLGFQTTQDDSGRGQEYEGSIKAELVIINDNDEDDNSMKENSHTQFGVRGYPAGPCGQMEAAGDRRPERRVGPGIKKIQKKHKPCCTVC